ncbi:hypothetical protein AB5J72_36335 [Streptomyces sp. CG1]
MCGVSPVERSSGSRQYRCLKRYTAREVFRLVRPPRP